MLPDHVFWNTKLDTLISYILVIHILYSIRNVT